MEKDGRTTGRKFKTRQKLFEAADTLFYGRGVRATSMDAVAEEAGVTKVTLYSHFASKDELVAAYLEQRDRRWREYSAGALSAHTEPGDRLLAIFDAYREWLVAGDLRGCAFINCAAEFPDHSHPVREVIRKHKAGVREQLRDLVAKAGADDPDSLAGRLFVVLEGAYVTAALEGDEQSFVRARSLFADLIYATDEKASA